MAGRQVPHKDLISPGLPKKGEDQTSSDQITEDLQKAKEVTGKFLGKVTETVTPVISKQGGKMGGFTTPLKDIADKTLIKKLFRVVLVALLIFVFIYIASLILKTASDNGDLGTVVVPTPTIAPYNPFNPSIYAEDEEVLQMEEDIKILDRELSTSLLKETILTPPVLDFEIDFTQ